MSLCPTCGATVRQQAQFCNVCGAKLAGAVTPALPPGSAPGGATILMAGPPDALTTAVYLSISTGQQIPLHSSVTIGRDPHDNAVYIADGRISRKHALLEERQGQWILTDLQSANGTYVNGRAITSPTPIQPGDLILIGDTSFRLETAGQHPSPQVWGPPSFQPSAPAFAPVATPGVLPPPGGWRSWQKAPLAEGRVEHLDRHTMKRDDLMQRGCMAIILGFIALPLAFIPMMQGSDLNVLNIRIADAHTPNMVDVKVMGDLYGVISQGDIIAVWGRPQNGLFVMQRAYNYTTGHEIAVKK